MEKGRLMIFNWS